MGNFKVPYFQNVRNMQKKYVNSIFQINFRTNIHNIGSLVRGTTVTTTSLKFKANLKTYNGIFVEFLKV